MLRGHPIRHLRSGNNKESFISLFCRYIYRVVENPCLKNIDRGENDRSQSLTSRRALLRQGRNSATAKKAVQIIENAWCRHRDRQMFRLLKHAVCAAEHALSNDILRRLSPREAELLRDPSMNVKVKFR